ILIDAIQSLKPDKDVPLHADTWRIYNILTYLYVEKSSQVTVANNLALSVRQLRRSQREAEEALAGYLWQRYKSKATVSVLQNTPAREKELEWVKESFPIVTSSVNELIEAVLKTITPLIETSGIQVKIAIQAGLPSISGQLAAVRQALINILTVTLSSTSSGVIQITTEMNEQEIQIRIFSDSPSHLKADNNVFNERFQMARQFMTAYGGQLVAESAQSDSAGFSAILAIPIKLQVPILVIDDNSDTLRLIQRYLTGTRYQFHGASDPNQVLEIASKLDPQVIVMDILLPGIDGWELMGRLHMHPKTQRIPIVVCTISPEEQLALTLGAAAFLRKPINRNLLLQTLDRLVSQLEQRSA
ncbi:MAG: response regulator, partial [Anaerolineales bacterium]